MFSDMNAYPTSKLGMEFSGTLVSGQTIMGLCRGEVSRATWYRTQLYSKHFRNQKLR